MFRSLGLGRQVEDGEVRFVIESLPARGRRRGGIESCGGILRRFCLGPGLGQETSFFRRRWRVDEDECRCRVVRDESLRE